MRFPLRQLVLLWLAWAVILIGFQFVADNRYQPDRPDNALAWTPNETGRRSQSDKPYLIDRFLNHQVAWDSEYYLSIATVGYDDPIGRTADTPEGAIPLNYAFFPFYPAIMSVVRVPFAALGLTPIAASTAAGVVVALLGTLAGMIALFDLVRGLFPDDERAGFRAVFALLIFPTGFFLAQVYTEGLFIGLAFGSLALLRRGRTDDRAWIAAAVLAFFAVLTRAVGVALVVPLAVAWITSARQGFTPRLIVRALCVAAPIVGYLVWRTALGANFELVEENFFGRGVLNLDAVAAGWGTAFDAITTGANTQMRVYYLLEIAAVVVTVVTSLALLGRAPGLALFSLAVIVIPLLSGAPQSLIRYALPAVAIYVMVARWGRSEAFDRAWTLASLLLMGMLVSLYTFDMWVA